MGWLQRLFGMEKPPEQAAVSPATDLAAGASAPPPERMGLNGEYDESGLAKRVALAYDQDPELSRIPSVDVLQTGTTVVLRGMVPSQAIIDKLVSVASGVPGAQSVDTSGMSIGIPAERVGLNGEYDESGLAKRVVQALQADANLASAAPFDIAQTGGTVVIRGRVPSQEMLDRMVAIAQGVSGATGVKTDEVVIG